MSSSVIHKCFTENVREKGERAALTACGGVQLTFSQLDDLSRRLSAYLSERRLSRGEAVAFYLPNNELYGIAVLAALRLGLVIVPVNTMTPPEEAHYVLSRSDAKVLLSVEGFAGRLGDVKEICEALSDVILLDKTGWRETAPLKEDPYVDSEDLAQILFTSGTSGQPRGAMLTHAALLANAEDCIKAFQLSDRDGYLCAMPLFHSFAMTVGMLIPFVSGGTIHIVSRPEPALIVARMEESEASVALGVPALFAALVTSGITPSRELKSLRFFVSGGAALYDSVREALQKRFRVPVYEGYGVTECAPVVSAQTPRDAEIRPGTVGRPLPSVKVRIVDEHERELGPEMVGEIAVAGPNVMLGYYDNPAASSEALKGGWFHTGDLGVLSSDGVLTVVDRMTDRITRKGLPVTPREVENVLLSLPGVAEAAVVGVSDSSGEEHVRAFVVPMTYPAPAGLSDRILEACRSRLAVYKIPQAVEFRQALPKTATGKILKRTLKQKWL